MPHREVRDLRFDDPGGQTQHVLLQERASSPSSADAPLHLPAILLKRQKAVNIC
jgi:hypothetical protein